MSEMKEGYKQTDIGVIPEDWDIKPIGSCIWNMRGGAPLKPSDFQKSGIKVLPKGAICKGGIIKLKEADTQFCSLEYFNKHISNQVDSRFTIVVLRDLVPSGPTIGTVVKNQYDKPLLLAQGVYGFLVNDQLLNDGYLIQLSNSAEYRRVMQSIMVGSTQVHITNGAFKNVLIPVPKPEEQKQIAAALSDVDGLIESLEKLIAKKRDMKTAAMQQLLTGKKRLPGFSGEWQTPVLEDLADFFKGKFLPKSAMSDSGQFSCIHYGELFTHYSEKIKGIRFKTNQPINTSFLSKTNDVLMPTSDVTPNGLAKASCISQDNIILGGDILVIRPKKSSDLNGVFLSYFIRFHKDEIMKRVSGTTVYHLYASDLKKLPIYLPSVEEQDAIVSVLEDMSEEIDALEKRLAKARSIKTGMMQELLTGKTRFIKTNKKQEAA